MNEKTIQIRCFEHCTFQILFPDFFIKSSVKKSTKLFDYLFQFSYKTGNDDAISFLDAALPELCENMKVIWGEKSKDFQNGFLSTDRAALPSNLFYPNEIRAEIAQRKANNDKLMRAVKKAKAQYEHAVKVLESYTGKKR